MKRTAEIERLVKRRRECLEDVHTNPEHYDCPEWCQFHDLNVFWQHRSHGTCILCNGETVNKWYVDEEKPLAPMLLCYPCQRRPWYVQTWAEGQLQTRAMIAVKAWESNEKLYALRQCGFPLVVVMRIKKYLE